MSGNRSGDGGPQQWVIAGGGYAATFGFVASDDPSSGPFAGSLSCGSLCRDGVELLAGPGVPLVLPWMGRLSSTVFDVHGERVDLTGASALTLDDGGRPLHGLAVDPRRWVVERTGASALVASAEPDFGAAFPLSHRVRVEAGVGEGGLTVRTTLEATGAVGVPVALGWHPYLRAPGSDPARRGVEVFLPFSVACELTDLLPTGVEHAAVPGWVLDPVLDHHWRASPGDEAVVRSGGFEVRLVVGAGYRWAMTWVPAAGAGFVCVEPMAGPLDPFLPGSGVPEAAPGRPWVGEYSIR